jgi:hypothetical protein
MTTSTTKATRLMLGIMLALPALNRLRDKLYMRRALGSALISICAAMTPAVAQPGSVAFPNTAGLMETKGKIDTQNAFFRDLGTNGRSCSTCHQFSDGMSVTPEHIQLRRA